MMELSEGTISCRGKQQERCSHGAASRDGSRAYRRPPLHLFLVATSIFCSSLLSARPATAFAPLQSPITNRIITTSTTTPPSSSISSSTILFAKVPKIDEWEVLKSGAIKGTIFNHPTLPDGYEITTSPLDEKSVLKDNNLVKTASGSKYRLIKQLPGKEVKPKKSKSKGGAKRQTIPMFGGGGAKEDKKQTTQKKKPQAKAKLVAKPVAKVKKQAVQKKKPQAKAKPVAKPVAKVKQQAVQKKKPQAKSKPVAKPVAKVKQQAVRKEASTDFDLNGKTVGSGKDVYLLSGKLIRSSSTRSQIYYAYKADKDGNPSGPKLTVKLSLKARLSRENKNYDRVFSKGRVLFAPIQGSRTCYIRKVAFCPDVDASEATSGVPSGFSALILESGDQNIRAFLTEKKSGLTGSDLRRAAVDARRSLEAMHSSGLVWTDLKAENYVLVGGTKSVNVRGIDLESAVTVKSAPEDYSPEACPPEFAKAEKDGVGYEFKVLKSYDIWSLGMLYYELAIGKNYFAGKAEGTMVTMLAQGTIVDINNPSIVAGLDAIPDDKFRDLVRSCLSIDPKKRPSIGQIIAHPYFLSF